MLRCCNLKVFKKDLTQHLADLEHTMGELSLPLSLHVPLSLSLTIHALICVVYVCAYILGFMTATVVCCYPFVDLLKDEGLTDAENIDPSALYTDVRMHVQCTCTLPLAFFPCPDTRAAYGLSLWARRLCHCVTPLV